MHLSEIVPSLLYFSAFGLGEALLPRPFSFLPPRCDDDDDDPFFSGGPKLSFGRVNLGFLGLLALTAGGPDFLRWYLPPFKNAVPPKARKPTPQPRQT